MRFQNLWLKSSDYKLCHDNDFAEPFIAAGHMFDAFKGTHEPAIANRAADCSHLEPTLIMSLKVAADPTAEPLTCTKRKRSHLFA